ncbi:MAG TPA: radical SAM protein, partial [Planctomycetota bacterium]|nr:radical SAM protein [Planctomycetota bacterium]
QSLPVRIQIEANRRCNLACLHCDIRHGQDTVLDGAAIERLLDALGGAAIEIMPYAGGEPTLAPLHELAPRLRRHNAFFSFTTNGVYTTREWFEPIADCTGRMTISIHGSTREIFDRIVPGGHFDTIARNMRDAVAVCERSGTQLLAGLVIMEPNVERLAEWFEWIADLGFRHAGLTNLYPGTSRLPELEPRRSGEQLAELIGAGMEAAQRRGVYVETNVPEAYYTRWPGNRPTRATRYDVFGDVNGICSMFRPGFCPLVANMITVEWDGTVLPCCRQRYPLGNLYREDFAALWNGPRMRRLRETFLQRRLYSGCIQCREFFCDSEHPSQPPVTDLQRGFTDEFPT